MTMYDIPPIQQIRVDIPLKTVYMYIFVNRALPGWDAWWEDFFDFLLGFASSTLEWRPHSSGVGVCSRPNLTAPQRTDIARYIRRAPPAEVKSHRTLRRATEMTPDQEQRLEVMYFSASLSGREGVES